MPRPAHITPALQSESEELQRHLTTHNLESVVRYYARGRNTPRDVIRGYLAPTMSRALADGLDLGNPAPHHSAWFEQVLSERADGLQAKPNTVLARRRIWNALYRELQSANLITHNPLDDVKRPREERSYKDILPAAALAHFFSTLKKENFSAFVAATLIYEQALRPGEVLTLTWDDIDLSAGLMLRPMAEIPLSEQSDRVLQQYLAAMGGPMFAQGRVFPTLNDHSLRQAFWSAFRSQSLPYVAPDRLRLAGLRDHRERLTPLIAGFKDPKVFKQNIALVDEIVRRTAERLKLGE